MYMRMIFISVLFITSYSTAFPKDTVFTTSFGQLRCSIDDSNRINLFFNTNKIAAPLLYAFPEYLGRWSKNTDPYNEILVLQETGVGTACNEIGDFRFIGISKSGNASFLQDSISACGSEGILDIDNNRMLINPITLIKGQSGYIPGEVWKYSDGHIARIDSNPPISITFRQATLGTSYVVQIHNYSNDTLRLWFSALEKKSSFISIPNLTNEFGWMEGYSIGANNSISIGGDGFATIKCFPPSQELSDIKFYWTEEGMGLSFSQHFLQKQANVRFKPIKKTWLQIFNAELANAPEIVLKEDSNRFFAKTNILISILINEIGYNVNVEASAIPYYSNELSGIYLNKIQIENIDLNLIPKEYIDGIKTITNEFLSEFLSSYCIMKFNSNDWKFKAVKGISIRNGRVVIFLL